MDHLHSSTSAERDTKVVFKDCAYLAIAEAIPTLERCDHRLSIRSYLAASRTEGIRTLAGMACLYPLAAVSTATHMNIEAYIDRPTRDFHLELMYHFLVIHRAATVRTLIRQRHFDKLVYLLLGEGG